MKKVAPEPDAAAYERWRNEQIELGLADLAAGRVADLRSSWAVAMRN